MNSILKILAIAFAMTCHGSWSYASTNFQNPPSAWGNKPAHELKTRQPGPFQTFRAIKTFKKLLKEQTLKALKSGETGKTQGGDGSRYLAIIGFAMGCLGVIALVLISILGVGGLIAAFVLGLVSYTQCSKAIKAPQQERKRNWVRMMAIAGMTLGIILISAAVVLTILILLGG